eukprot:scaffold68847_cov68-Phaeocystis_antarctica.AAC.4
MCGPRIPMHIVSVRMQTVDAAMRLVPAWLAEAAVERRRAALQLHAIGERWRARGRRRRERALASRLATAAKALALLARPCVAPGQARCHRDAARARSVRRCRGGSR